MKIKIFLLNVFLPLLEACSRQNTDVLQSPDRECSAQIQFSITDSGIPEYPVKMMVFGIPIFGTSKWTRY